MRQAAMRLPSWLGADQVLRPLPEKTVNAIDYDHASGSLSIDGVALLEPGLLGAGLRKQLERSGRWQRTGAKRRPILYSDAARTLRGLAVRFVLIEFNGARLSRVQIGFAHVPSSQPSAQALPPAATPVVFDHPPEDEHPGPARLQLQTPDGRVILAYRSSTTEVQLVITGDHFTAIDQAG